MSITHEQFRLQMDRLVDTWSEKHFPEQREQMIWETVQGLDYNLVIGIVDQFIRTAKTAPLPVDFSQAVNAAVSSSEAKIFKLGDYRPRATAKCLDCGDSGFVHVERREEHAQWARWGSGSAPCHCSRGRELIEAGKRMRPTPVDLGGQFNGAWASSYRIVPFYEAIKREVSRPTPPPEAGA